MFGKKERTDEQLVHDIISGGRDEEQAIAYLLKRDFPKISHLVVQRNGSVEDAEDIIQEAIGVLLFNIKRKVFKGESSISTYLFAICKGMWYKRFQKYVRERNYQSSLQVDDRDDDTPEVQILDEEQKDLLEKLFDQLKEGCKEVLFRWSLGESMDDIAKSLSFKNSQIAMNKKNKCLNELHERMEQDSAIASLAHGLRNI
jgi:RNA polymerase sigma factor (sigma-70 family)